MNIVIPVLVRKNGGSEKLSDLLKHAVGSKCRNLVHKMSKSTFSVYQSLLTWNEWKDLERTDICIRVDGDRGWKVGLEERDGRMNCLTPNNKHPD